MRPPGREQRGRQPQGVGDDHVVVGKPVDDEQRSREARGEWQQRRAVVVVRLLLRQSEVALGVAGVVQTPLGDRCASHGRVEDVGTTQHGESSEVSAEGPATDSHATGVDIVGVRRRHRLEGGDLVLERGRGQVTAHCAVPGGATSRCAPPIGHHDHVSLVGEPLVGAVHQARRDDQACVGSAVRGHDHRQARRSGHVAGGEEHGDVEVTLASAQEMDLR